MAFKLKPSSEINTIIAVSGMLLFVTACTNSTDTGNNSTGSTEVTSSTEPTKIDTITGSGTVTNYMTTNNTTDTATGRTSGVKRKGKATIKMMENSIAKIEADKMGVYENTEVRPAYPGGQTALDDYINSRIEYPQTAIDDNKQGMVQVQFVVDENGKVINAKTIGNKVDDGLDEEAVRVISNMPKRTPGMVKGKKVKTRLVLPIFYMIEE